MDAFDITTLSARKRRFLERFLLEMHLTLHLSSAPVTLTDLPQRFRDRIFVDGTCWVWLGQCSDKGYGRISCWATHRLLFLCSYGWVPDLLDHIVCDNKLCCNPEHVKPSTILENTRRSNVRDVCRNGHDISIFGRNKYGGCNECNRIRHQERYHARWQTDRYHSTTKVVPPLRPPVSRPESQITAYERANGQQGPSRSS